MPPPPPTKESLIIVVGLSLLRLSFIHFKILAFNDQVLQGIFNFYKTRILLTLWGFHAIIKLIKSQSRAKLLYPYIECPHQTKSLMNYTCR